MRRARGRTEACEFGLDHVHLFVSGCRKYSVPYMAQRLKGASAYAIRHRLRDRVRGKLWGDPFWSDGYFCRSVGSTITETVRCRTAGRGSTGCLSSGQNLRSWRGTSTGRQGWPIPARPDGLQPVVVQIIHNLYTSMRLSFNLYFILI